MVHEPAAQLFVIDSLTEHMSETEQTSFSTRPLTFRSSTSNGVVMTFEAAKTLAFVVNRTFVLRLEANDVLTTDLPKVPAADVAHLGSDGLVSVGATVHGGMILAGRLSREEGSKADAAVDAAFGAVTGRDRSLRCPPGFEGRVTSVEHLHHEPHEGRSIAVTVSSERPVTLGDVLAIDGQRATLTQLVASIDTGDDGLWPGRTGAFTVERVRPTAVDVMQARSIGPYSLVTQQPLRGREQLGGQLVTLEQAEALLDRGAAHTVYELYTVKSDDESARLALYEAIVRDTRDADIKSMPSATRAIEWHLRAMGLTTDFTEREIELGLMGRDELRAVAPGVVTRAETIDLTPWKAIPGGLFCEDIFGAKSQWFGRVELAVPVLHPWARKSAATLLGWSAAHLEDVLMGRQVLNGAVGSPAVHAALQTVDLDRPVTGAETLSSAMKGSRRRPTDLCFNTWPVLPPSLRPMLPTENGRYATSTLNDSYRHLIETNLQNPLASVNGLRALQEALDRLLAALGDAQALVPRPVAVELFKPWVYGRLERAGHVTSLKAAKQLVVAQEPRALAMLDAVVAQTPLLLFGEGSSKPVGVSVSLWNEPALGLSDAVIGALGLVPGQVVQAHVPVHPEAVRETRALTVGRSPGPKPAENEQWLSRASRLESLGEYLFSTALVGAVDPIRDRRARLLTGRRHVVDVRDGTP